MDLQMKETDDEVKTIAAYAPLVKHIAGRIAMYLPPHIELDDLLGDGVIGLMEAVKKYQPGRGVQFKTYASARIRGAILDGLRRLDWAPRRLRRKARDLERRVGELSHELGRPPSADELAASMGMSRDEVESLMAETSGSFIVSLDELVKITDNSSFMLSDTIRDETQDVPAEIERKERQDVLRETIDQLGERERTCISLFYYEGLTNKEVAHVMGVSPARVCFLHNRALGKLKGRLAEWSQGQGAARDS